MNMNAVKRLAPAVFAAALSASAAFAGETKSKPEDVAKLIPQETEAQFLHDASEVKVALAGKGGAFCDNESGFDAHLFFPAVQPPVEIPVIECMMK